MLDAAHEGAGSSAAVQSSIAAHSSARSTGVSTPAGDVALAAYTADVASPKFALEHKKQCMRTSMERRLRVVLRVRVCSPAASARKLLWRLACRHDCTVCCAAGGRQL